MPILENAARAIIDPRKLLDYALDPRHPRGRDKARVFRSALGYDRSNRSELVESIRRGILVHEAIPVFEDRYGRHFRVDIPMTGPGGTATVMTGWIYDRGSDVPRLTTALVLRTA
jgi:hypothetical protein